MHKLLPLILLILLGCGSEAPPPTSEQTNPSVTKLRFGDITPQDKGLTNSLYILQKRLELAEIPVEFVRWDTNEYEIHIKLKNPNDLPALQFLSGTVGEFSIREVYSNEDIRERWDYTQAIDPALAYENTVPARLKPFGGLSGAIGRVAIKDTTFIAQNIAFKPIQEKLPKDARFRWGDMRNDSLSFFATKAYEIVPPIDHRDFQTASLQESNNDGTAIMIKLHDISQPKLADLTEVNLAKPLVLMVDEYVYSAPIVRSKTEKGELMISGLEEGKQQKWLLAILESGLLKFPLHTVQDSIQ